MAPISAFSRQAIWPQIAGRVLVHDAVYVNKGVNRRPLPTDTQIGSGFQNAAEVLLKCGVGKIPVTSRLIKRRFSPGA